MGDTDPESQAAGQADAGVTETDPAKAAEADAWLAQFRADNAAKVMEYDFEAAAATEAEARQQVTRRDYDLSQAGKSDKEAAQARADATADERKAAHDAARHDEFEAKAETERHMADASVQLAQHFRADAAAADAEHQRLTTELGEEVTIFQGARSDYETLQEEAVAARRIATDEAHLQHTGDPAPGHATEERHEP